MFILKAQETSREQTHCSLRNHCFYLRQPMQHARPHEPKAHNTPHHPSLQTSPKTEGFDRSTYRNAMRQCVKLPSSHHHLTSLDLIPRHLSVDLLLFSDRSAQHLRDLEAIVYCRIPHHAQPCRKCTCDALPATFGPCGTVP